MGYIRYFWYLFKHKWYVLIECAREGLTYRGLMHDLDKFLPELFIPYVRHYYYGINEGAYQEAWDLHKMRNKHHWQYWLDTSKKPQEMAHPYNIEMFCDWVGAGKARGKHSPKNDPYREVKDFYRRKGGKMKLHENTRKWIENKLYGGK